MAIGRPTHRAAAWLLAATLAAAAACAPAAPARPPAPMSAGNLPQHTLPAGGEAMLATPPAAEDVALGRRIYREGVGEGDRPVLGVRFGGVEASGAAVACVSCHRRSGLGSVEGVDVVSPIAGRFIFQDEDPAIASMNVRTLRQFNQRHAALDATTFAAAVRDGRHVGGRELSPMMPRYALSDTELRALQAYLRTLSAQWSPGVSAQTLELATVITPDVSPERREIFLQTLKAAVAHKNANFAPGMRTMSTAAEMLLRTNRYWNLQVWELQGAPQTWRAQLDAFQAAKPVFAILSGLGGGEWAPVHRFCEEQAVPCWFPSVAAAPSRARMGFYSLYFSAGVALEADVLAEHLRRRAPKALLQVHLGDAAGRAGAARLTAELAAAPPKAWRSSPRTVELDGRADDAALAQALERAIAGLDPEAAVMLWWPQQRLAVLERVPAPAARRYLSAGLAPQAHETLAAAWRSAPTHLLYPYQLPARRHATLFYMHAWLKERKLPLRDEALQSETYFAVSYFSDTLTDMLDNLHRDYLVERGENMLSVREGQKAEDEARELLNAKHQKAPGGGGAQAVAARLAAPSPNVEDRRMPRPLPGRAADVKVKREGTSIYPRLSLAPGQRFASKGAYVASFNEAAALDPEAEWIVP